MVGLGPTIHEFRWQERVAASKLVDGRAKHDHDEKGAAELSLADVVVVIPAATGIQTAIDL
jgi:hypothetical protein